MMSRLRRIAVTQARMSKNSGTDITAPSHGLSCLSSRLSVMGVSRKKFNSRGRGLHDCWAKRITLRGTKE